MRITLSRHTDGDTSSRCQRVDGTSTWQRYHGGQARFFPVHDLTHYAVETTLGHHRSFYGLVADGWDLKDFGSPWPRGSLPPEAELTEVIVGFLDLERAQGVELTAADLRTHLAQYEAARPAGRAPLPDAALPGDGELGAIRRRRDALGGRWLAVPPGGSLELDYPEPGAETPAHR